MEEIDGWAAVWVRRHGMVEKCVPVDAVEGHLWVCRRDGLHHLFDVVQGGVWIAGVVHHAVVSASGFPWWGKDADF